MYDVLVLVSEHLNSLTLWDMVSSIASFHSQISDAFNCQKCLAKNNLKLREIKDCFKPNLLSERKILFKGYRITFLKCVGNFRLPEWDEIYQLYEAWKTNGGNPFGALFADIPSRNLDVFYLIDSLVNMEINKKRK